MVQTGLNSGEPIDADVVFGEIEEEYMRTKPEDLIGQCREIIGGPKLVVDRMLEPCYEVVLLESGERIEMGMTELLQCPPDDVVPVIRRAEELVKEAFGKIEILERIDEEGCVRLEFSPPPGDDPYERLEPALNYLRSAGMLKRVMPVIR